ncbi:hypothetical protein AB833_09420 [Chromatiales bacterium (ex Bugula neritina AB1)]|nr:hypothetical protein AB833_09420 [Chromatiales bacterium (ex Bugula neritina AB1)]
MGLRILIIAVISSIVLFAAMRFHDQNYPARTVDISGAEKLEWQDLVPPMEPLGDALADTPMNIRFDLGYIGKVQADANAHVISRDGPEYRNAMTLLEKHRSDGVDVDRLLAAVTGRDQAIGARGKAVNSALDGKLVRLPGYALPLELEEDGVTEFLLVPFVGACIHVPPPPPNQVVLAELESAYQVKGLYDPVLITGHLRAQPASSELHLVDGQAQVPMGYSMQVMHIEPME